MILPDDIHDGTLEYAARLVEQPSFTDLLGVLAKKKRAREDADLRHRARTELRAELAEQLRAMKNRPELTPEAALARLAALEEDRHHEAHMSDAWPLAWRGWIDIEAIVRCNSNTIPPQARYRITLTEKGREVLARHQEAATAATEPASA